MRTKTHWLFFCKFLGRSINMSDNQNKIGAMFEKALANRGVKPKEEPKEEIKEKEEKTSEKEDIISEDKKEVIVEDTDEIELRKEFERQLHNTLDADDVDLDYDEEETDNQTTMIKIEDLEDYPDQPFRAYSEEKENEMMDSIKVNGIIQDLIVRPLENGKYQILSGHNRKRCE